MTTWLATTDTVSERPLLRRSPLLPGESLPSLLWRLQQLNGYDDSALLAELVGARTTNAGTRGVGGRLKDSIEKPTHEQLYQQLSTLTCISPIDLYAATRHRFASVLVPPGIKPPSIRLPVLPLSTDPGRCIMPISSTSRLSALPTTHTADTAGYITLPILETANTRTHLYGHHSAQFCPLCLRQDRTPYHRLLWQPVCVAACLVHRCLLHDSCPGCHRRVPIADVVGAACGGCGTPLSEAEPTTLEDDPSGLCIQEIIQSWFTGSQTSDSRQITLDRHIPHKGHGDADLVGAGGVGDIRNIGNGVGAHPLEAGALHNYLPLDTLGQSLPDVSPNVLYIIVRALRHMFGGTAGLPKLSEHDQQRGQLARRYREPQRDARYRYTLYCKTVTRLLHYQREDGQHPESNFVREAIAICSQPDPLYGVSYQLGKLAVMEQYRYEMALLRARYITVEEAAQLLGTNVSTVKKLARLHNLDTRRFGRRGTHRTVICLRRAHLDKLYSIWQRTFPLDQACKSLGVTEALARELVDRKLLQVAPDVIQHRAYESYGSRMSANDSSLLRFSTDELNSCRNRILQYVQYVEADAWATLAASEGMVTIAEAAETLSHICQENLTVVGVLSLIRSGRVHAYALRCAATSDVEATERNGARDENGDEERQEENASIGLRDLYLSAREVERFGEELRSTPKRLRRI